MTRPPLKDGTAGPRTREALHLFDKPDSYRRGYWKGRLTPRHSRQALNALAGSAEGGPNYRAGYEMGRQVRIHGIKKALRKAKP